MAARKYNYSGAPHSALDFAANYYQLTPGEYAAYLATAEVESGYNPHAVGDGGTSFGFFQHHAGGAGGPTVASAKKYLNPYESAKERARWFAERDIDTGAEAAALQRPADPTGYARKVDAAISGIAKGVKKIAGGNPKHPPMRKEIRNYLIGQGFRHTSGDRTPANNSASGGVSNSSHLTTNTSRWADDYVASEAKMRAAAQAVKSKWPAVTTLVHDAGSGLHLHVEGPGGFSADSQDAPASESDSDGLVAAITGAAKDLAGIATGGLLAAALVIGALALIVLGAGSATGAIGGSKA